MSFQAYLDTIKAKTGKTPEDFKNIAESNKILKLDMKATEFTDWLKADFGLGHGHGMALWAQFVSNGWLKTKNTKMNKGYKGGKEQ